MEEHPVKVYIYDLSRGMARAMSAMLIGKQLDGIWHTGIVAYGQEWFYGGMGIESCPPGGTIMGQPDQIEDLGTTQIPFDLFMQQLEELSQTTFQPKCYHLFNHNCNTFSDELAMFLTGKGIPSQITQLPQDVLSTPFGQMIKPMLDSMQVTPEGGHHPFQQAARNPPTGASATGYSQPSQGATNIQSPTVQREQPNATLQKYLNLPTFSLEKVTDSFNSSKSDIHSTINGENQKLLDEFCEYVSIKEPAWSPSPRHITSFDNVIKNSDLSDELKGVTLGLLQEAALRDDIVVLISNDPQQHVIKWLHNIDQNTVTVQERIIKIACNSCSKLDGRTWMLFNKEWQLNGDLTCNRKLLSRCIMLTVLSDKEGIQEGGAALARSATALKVDEDTALEIGSALIEALENSELTTDAAENCLQGLQSCMSFNKEVADLAAVMGLDVKKYSNKSSACDALVKNITTKYLPSTTN